MTYDLTDSVDVNKAKTRFENLLDKGKEIELKELKQKVIVCKRDINVNMIEELKQKRTNAS